MLTIPYFSPHTFDSIHTTLNYLNEHYQIQSFEAELSVPEIVAKEGGPPSFRGVFIRAPGILEVGPEVQVLAEVQLPSDKPTKSDPAAESLEVNITYSLACNVLCVYLLHMSTLWNLLITYGTASLLLLYTLKPRAVFLLSVICLGVRH